MRITRKDFLNGAATLLGGALLKPLAGLAGPSGPDASTREHFLARGIGSQDAGYYPPALTGMRGSHPGSFEAAHALRDGQAWNPASAVATGEQYDLIVVGGGISGLAAAYFYRQQRGDSAKILLLDNHDDFGGHAKRNEFRGGSLIGYGGTQEIEGWPNWSEAAKGLLSDLGIRPERFEQVYYEREFRRTHGLKHAVFFDRATFGRDALVTDVGLPDWGAFAARTPLSAQARRDLIRLQTERIDYLPGLSTDEKVARLRRMSFETFLRQHAKVDPQVVDYFRTFVTGGFGAQIDAMPALTSLQVGPFLETYWDGQQGLTRAAAEGMGLPAMPGASELEQKGEPQFVYYHFPDGNASIARMLVRTLIPGSAPGRSMEDIVTARMDYAQLDRPGSAVRIRLNSTALNVRHSGESGSAQGVEVGYWRDGKAYSARARHCILACYNAMVPQLCPELPQKQREALHFGAKVPLVYANAQLRRWSSLKKLGAAMVYCPTAYFSEVYMDFPVSMGNYHYTRDPEQPVVLHMVRVPCKPGLPARAQRRAGRLELYTTPFSTFEQQIREQLTAMLGPGGFDARRDLEAITVNRWPHGYADWYEDLEDPQWPAEERPNVIGRQRFGRIAIANSDAAGSAQTQAAIDEAHRAVGELLSL